MNNFINAVILANQKIYELIAKTPHQTLAQKLQQGAGGDISLQIDIEAEKIFIEHLSLYGQIYSEEGGYIGEKSEDLIIIDPIDGSDNFLSKIPYFGTSVAKKRDGKVTCGVITNLANGDIFIKIQDTLLQGSLHVKEFFPLQKNNFSSAGLFERAYRSEFFAQKLRDNSIKYRSLGALALSLAYGHSVDFVLYEGSSREFDIAAGWFICEDLYRIKEENFLFVSKDKQNFDRMLSKIINT